MYWKGNHFLLIQTPAELHEKGRELLEADIFIRIQKLPSFLGLTFIICYTPSTKVSNTCGNSLSLCSVNEYFPLNNAQSYSAARSNMA